MAHARTARLMSPTSLLTMESSLVCFCTDCFNPVCARVSQRTHLPTTTIEGGARLSALATPITHIAAQRRSDVDRTTHAADAGRTAQIDFLCLDMNLCTRFLVVAHKHSS